MYFEYESFVHNSAPTEPASDELNIIGLELEVSQFGDYSILNGLIEDGIINTYDMDNGAAIQLEDEDQHDVEKELIFNADTVENIKARLQQVSILQREAHTERNTSAHVHLNRLYIESLGLEELDIYKASEAIAPLIFDISGRNSSSWSEWTPSRIKRDKDLIERFSEVDDILPRSEDEYGYSSRYELCNVQNTSTIEIRGFSNYYNFNSEIIGLYIDVVSELIPTLAQTMKGRSYSKEPEAVFETVEEFMDTHPKIKEFNLPEWKIWRQTVAEYKAKIIDKYYSEYKEAYEYLMAALQTTSTGEKMRLLSHVNEDLLPETLALNNAAMNQQITEMIKAANKEFKNNIWRI